MSMVFRYALFASLVLFVFSCKEDEGREIRRLAIENEAISPVSMSIETYCFYNYSIPGSIDDLVSFLREYRDSVCDEIMYPGAKIDSVISVLNAPDTRYAAYQDSCFLYCPSIGLGAVQYGSPRNWINRRTLSQRPKISFSAFSNEGRILNIPEESIQSAIDSVRRKYTHLVFISYHHPKDSPLYDGFEMMPGREFQDTVIYRILLEYNRGKGIKCTAPEELPAQKYHGYGFEEKQYEEIQDDVVFLAAPMIEDLSSLMDSLSKKYDFHKLHFNSSLRYIR